MDYDFLQIPGYRPQWIDDTSEFIDVHRSLLDGLVGDSIAAVHVLWDLRSDEHFREGPVVVTLAGVEPVEVCASKLTDLSLTRGLIDLERRVEWDWEDEPWVFEWRRDTLPSITQVLGQRVRAVEVLENQLTIGRGQAWCLGGIELVTAVGGLAIFNGLDDTQVAMSGGAEGWRRVERPDHEA